MKDTIKNYAKKYWNFCGTDRFLFIIVVVHAVLGILGAQFDKWDYGAMLVVFGWRALVESNPKSGNEMPVGKVGEQ